MKRIDELLEKYFEAKTTLEEEKELNLYFSSKKLSEEHKQYLPLFTLFAEEQQMTFPKQKEVIKKNPAWVRYVTWSGVAASFLILFVLLLTPAKKSASTYFVQNGKRINDVELAQRFAEEKIMKVSEILNKNIQPLYSADERLKESLEPLSQAENIINRNK